MADASDSKSDDILSCGFKSHHPQNETREVPEALPVFSLGYEGGI